MKENMEGCEDPFVRKL